MERPLIVDLDGTLLKTDLLIESALVLFKRKPLMALLLPLWLCRGKAVLKRRLAQQVELEVDLLPYREELCEYLRAERARGRMLALVSASDELLVRQIRDHLGFFDRHMASDGHVNLKGTAKRDRLVAEYGEHGFDYIGDSRADLVVWASARQGIVVSPSKRLRARAMKQTELIDVLVSKRASPFAYLRALRAHHWVKNLLIFIPIFLAHRINELDLVADLSIGFLSFCLLTSGLYVFNDLLDLNADRRHPRKRLRPLAAGELQLPRAMIMVPVLVAGAFLLSWQMRPQFILALGAYCVVTLTYSLRLKQIVLLDVLVLAGLYMLRILAGAAAGGIPLSRWLLGFSMFFFMSLALLKRYTEILTMTAAAGKATDVRGYRSQDSSLILAMGSASGYLSVVVLALYVDTATAERLYTLNQLLWLICPVLLYWISYLWLMAHRNRMPYDPVVFAARNRTSRLLVLIMVALFVLAM